MAAAPTNQEDGMTVLAVFVAVVAFVLSAWAIKETARAFNHLLRK
jgi:hypothetical protein